MWRVEPVYSLIAGEWEGGGWISNTPLSKLLQNKLQRHMHARAHTHAHVFSTGCAQSKRVKKASWSRQVDFSVHVDVSRSWLRLQQILPDTHSPTERKWVSSGSIQSLILYISVSSVQISAFVADKSSNIRLKSTKQNIFGCSIYLIYPQLPHFVPTVVQCNVLSLRWSLILLPSEVAVTNNLVCSLWMLLVTDSLFWLTISKLTCKTVLNPHRHKECVYSLNRALKIYSVVAQSKTEPL